MKFSTAFAACLAAVSAVAVPKTFVLKEGEVAYLAKNEKGEQAIVIVEPEAAQEGMAKRWSWLDWRMFEPIC
ncbi:hypothetical protein DICA1_C12508 [Diutina catenulata]